MALFPCDPIIAASLTGNSLDASRFIIHFATLSATTTAARALWRPLLTTAVS